MSPSQRTWGYWTRAKLQVLADYLPAFTTAAKAQKERIYLDAFAGEGKGIDRTTGEEFEGSARIALGAKPEFTKVRLFELPTKAKLLEVSLAKEFPGRDLKVYGGDCNDSIAVALKDLAKVRWAPTFAFLDPDGMELSWSTVKSLADHKRGYRKAAGKPEYKVEIWMLFPTQGLIRTLTFKKPLAEKEVARATRLFGSEAWRVIYEMRKRDEFTGEDAAEEYLNLMRHRLQVDLGYRWTHPLAVKNLRGSLIYHMILATDNPTGTRIMASIYSRAAAEIPEMRKEILEAQKSPGQLKLDVGPSPKAKVQPYEYEAPWTPPS